MYERQALQHALDLRERHVLQRRHARFLGSQLSSAFDLVIQRGCWGCPTSYNFCSRSERTSKLSGRQHHGAGQLRASFRRLARWRREGASTAVGGLPGPAALASNTSGLRTRYY